MSQASSADRPGPQDVVPINGAANYNVRLVELQQARLPDWPPNANMITEDAESEIRRYWNFVAARRIWSPYPILSYCLGAATYRGGELLARYFLFPVRDPSVQNQAIAQLVCKLKEIDGSTNVNLLVDALREDELSTENLEDIRNALNLPPSKAMAAPILYDRAWRALDSNNLDEAIHELDACLYANPEQRLALEAYYNLSATIWRKFHFNERTGSTVTDEEFKWVQACNVCLRRALTIYDHLPRKEQLESEMLQMHQAIKASLSPTISYGAIIYEYGRREWRKPQGVPNLRCLTEVNMPLNY
jgi:hypothetical protein